MTPAARALLFLGALAGVSLSGVRVARADAVGAITSPVPPRESLKHVIVPEGLTVEIVAHEPDVIDPVAVRFDEQGRMWVVEMRDYPTADTKGITARSRISILRDRDGDGFYETAVVFADDLPYATGLQPWRGGAFVTMAGQVAYMKDTDGDDRADVNETWYRGFAEENTQLRANHPRLALDNHIYVVNGLRGGTIVDAQRPEAAPVSISGMDFRFDPLARKFEAVSGAGQFGLTFDDYGNRFVCSNRNPAIHVVLEDRHLRRNPLVAVSAVSTDVAKAGAESRLFPIARSWTTSHLHAGQFTAACGVHVYRGDALPAEYHGNLFICEPTGHLIHREIMTPHGVSFRSAAAREGAEFFASRDAWCCPVNLEVGPDGALYVVDMYRAVIEHPEWMPEELRQRPDLVAGNDRGRIYRVVPRGFMRPATPQLSANSPGELVELLAHPNAWWRETAARLLLERQETQLAPQLEQLARSQTTPLARIHALRLLEGLGRLSEATLVKLLKDRNPRVVEQAIIAAEPRIAEPNELRNRVAQLVAHDDARVRFQAWLVAAPQPTPPAHPADRWESDAMLIAAGERAGTALAAMLEQPAALEANVADPKRFVTELARMAAAGNDDREAAVAIEAILHHPTYARAALIGFLTEALRDGESIAALRFKLAASSQAKLKQLFAQAQAAAADDKLPAESRGEAVALLRFAEDSAHLLALLALEESNQLVRSSAISALAQLPTIEPWHKLLDQFASETPALQRAILDGVFTAEDRIRLLMDKVAAERIRPTEIDANRVQQLLNHSDSAIRDQATSLLTDALPADREQALAEYRAALAMTPDPAQGRAVFEKHCAVCHQIGGIGVAFAPDISDSRERSAQQLLTDIIQPNRAIDSNYFSYTVLTVDGLVHTGVLAGETSTSVTLKQSEGKSITLRRDQIDELRSDGVSFMPDGMEKDISLQQMADLIAYIKNWRYLAEQGPSARP